MRSSAWPSCASIPRMACLKNAALISSSCPATWPRAFCTSASAHRTKPNGCRHPMLSAISLINLLISEMALSIGWRHPFGFVRCADALVQKARGQVAGHDELMSAAFFKQAILGIEAQLGHALLLIRAVAGEASIREDRPDLPVEIHGLGGGFTGDGDCAPQKYQAHGGTRGQNT